MAKNPKEPKKNGRPTIYTQELANRVCEELALGKSLRTVCTPDDMPAIRTVFNWFNTKEGFVQQYARAKQEAADAMAEEILDISDDSSNDKYEDAKGNIRTDWEVVGRSKLRIDTRKWLMSKMKPKRYGDKLDITSGDKPLPTPIYGGLSAKPDDVHVPRHDSDEEDIPA